MGTTRQADEGLEGIRWRVGANGYVIGYANGRQYIQHRVIWEREVGPIDHATAVEIGDRIVAAPCGEHDAQVGVGGAGEGRGKK